MAYAILIHLIEAEAVNKLSGETLLSIKGDAELASYSESCIYKTIQKLLERACVARGVKVGKAETFYISDAGMDSLKEAGYVA